MVGYDEVDALEGVDPADESFLPPVTVPTTFLAPPTTACATSGVWSFTKPAALSTWRWTFGSSQTFLAFVRICS